MFTKYELYSTAESPYCYRGTAVLRNRLNIRDNTALKAAEEEITAIMQYELLRYPIRGHFSKTHLCRIHRFLFKDIYSFAGYFRREQIGKATTWFYPPNLIERELDKLCATIKTNHFFIGYPFPQLLDQLAFVMAELNIIHPFREGNGRAVREFIRELALKNSYDINWGLADKESILSASIESVDDYRALIPVLKKCLTKD